MSLTRDARRCDVSDQTGRRSPLRDSVRAPRQLVQFIDRCGTALMAPPMPVSAASHDSTLLSPTVHLPRCQPTAQSNGGIHLHCVEQHPDSAFLRPSQFITQNAATIRPEPKCVLGIFHMGQESRPQVESGVEFLERDSKPLQPARVFGGATRAPPAVFEAEPRPPESFPLFSALRMASRS